MRIKDCRKCPKFRQRCWDEYRYQFSIKRNITRHHLYGYCELHHKNCRDVKQCDPVLAMQVKMEV